MDTPELPVNQLEAGRAYYEALSQLGFEPEGLFWAYGVEEEKFRLWLVWSGLDRYGPLAISKLLFKAYRSAVLPETIDPFVVNVITYEHAVGSLSKDMDVKLPNGEDPVAFLVAHRDEGIKYNVKREWIYHFQNRRHNAKKIDRGWRKLNENISALAA